MRRERRSRYRAPVRVEHATADHTALTQHDITEVDGDEARTLDRGDRGRLQPARHGIGALGKTFDEERGLGVVELLLVAGSAPARDPLFDAHRERRDRPRVDIHHPSAQRARSLQFQLDVARPGLDRELLRLRKSTEASRYLVGTGLEPGNGERAIVPGDAVCRRGVPLHDVRDETPIDASVVGSEGLTSKRNRSRKRAAPAETETPIQHQHHEAQEDCGSEHTAGPISRCCAGSWFGTCSGPGRDSS